MNRMTTLLLMSGALALSACASKAPKQLPPDPGPATSIGTETQGPVPGSQADFVAFTRGQDTIFFETDRYNIDSEDVAALTKNLLTLIKDQAVRQKMGEAARVRALELFASEKITGELVELYEKVLV